MYLLLHHLLLKCCFSTAAVAAPLSAVASHLLDIKLEQRLKWILQLRPLCNLPLLLRDLLEQLLPC
jgi:hypothetical protein